MVAIGSFGSSAVYSEAVLEQNGDVKSSVRNDLKEKSIQGGWSPTGKPVAPSTTLVGRNPEREPPGQGRGLR